MEIRECRECGKPIPQKRLNRWPGVLSCSADCTESYMRRNRRSLSPHEGLGLTTGAIGAISELVVAAELLRRGYDVFRNVAPTGKVDLVAMKQEKVVKVQVRTGRISPSTGTLNYPKQGISGCDVVAVAMCENVRYFTPDDLAVTSLILDA